MIVEALNIDGVNVLIHFIFIPICIFKIKWKFLNLCLIVYVCRFLGESDHKRFFHFPMKDKTVTLLNLHILQACWPILVKFHLQHPRIETSRLGLIQTVHEGKWQMRHPSWRPAPGWALHCSLESCESHCTKGTENVNITKLNRSTGIPFRAVNGTMTE